jgi:anaerobic magnesium-protoporphyrin IX monomethyl ester cyclase
LLELSKSDDYPSWKKMSENKKTTKVALINTPLPEGEYHHPYLPPLGLSYLAAVLERENIEIKVLDCPVCNINHEKLKAELASFEPELVGISSMTPTIPSALKSARVSKEVCPEAKVVLGGPHATFMDEQILTEEAAVDIVVRGEGEETLVELVQYSLGSESLQNIKGISFRKDKQIIRAPNRPIIQDLDSLPFPAYKYLQIDKYRTYGKKFFPIMSSRGCPFQCSFCVASQMFGAKFRARSAKNVVDELEWLKNTYNADGISFNDDTLSFDRKRMLDICDEMINRKLFLPWGCQTRVDTVSKEILSKMKQAHCNAVSFGVESGCQRILDAVKKKITIEQAEKAIKLAKEQGLFVTVSTIIGYPGETKETMMQTLDLIRRIEPDDAWICTATPYPGTELRALVESNGWKISNDWSEYNTMIKPVFENPLLPAEEISNVRNLFYDRLYTPQYVFRQLKKGYLKGNFYSKMMTRAAVKYLLWRARSKF